MKADLSKLSSREKDELILALMRENEDLKEQNRLLSERVKALEGQISKNSRNSSKPPSSDGIKKPEVSKKDRGTGRKAGGQKGHEGQTLEFSEEPDIVDICKVEECEQCGKSLKGEVSEDYERRQVFELPRLKVEVTEYRSEIKICDECGKENRGAFPKGVSQPVQYGPFLKATAVYLNTYQLLPYDRIGELFQDVFGHRVSVGTMVKANQRCHELLGEVEGEIKRQLREAEVMNVDETGLRIEGKRSWLHVAGTDKLTYYDVHTKRGKEAMEAMGILPGFEGRAIHDHWKPYFQYDCEHGLCNAHHIRELEFIHEQYEQGWAQQMKECLLDMKDEVDQREVGKQVLTEDNCRELEKRYDYILKKGLTEISVLPQPPPGKRGRKKQSPAKNLWDRLKDYKKEVLAFVYDIQVSFDNNQAERDLRMMKVQQKISGCFRSWAGAQSFCRIRGYISTARKNSVNVMDALTGVFQGSPFIPKSV